jgi:4-hydroxy-2-oxoglutarate aldolase
MRLQGIVPPLVTPFAADGGLDLRAFEANLERYAAFELGGYLVLGSNGEVASLEEGEKLRLVRAARAGGGGRLLLAGTGLETTRATIEFTRRAAEAGADAALVLTPHYYRAQMTFDVLRRHFEAVAQASPVPVLLYSVPQFTGLAFPPALASALAAHPNVAGMKESSGDLALLARIVADVPPTFAFACGSAPVIYPALCSGAVAGVLAVACCAPGPVVALHAAFARGDHARARALQRALTPLATAVGALHGVAGLKAAMDMAGFRGGDPRAPLLPAPPSAREELQRLLARLDDDVAAIGA